MTRERSEAVYKFHFVVIITEQLFCLLATQEVSDTSMHCLQEQRQRVRFVFPGREIKSLVNPSIEGLIVL